MSEPIKAFDDFIEAHSKTVRVDVTSTKGSAPRDSGTWMLVNESNIFGTIGGGQLEYIAIEEARRLILQDVGEELEVKMPLGPEIGQCCGGFVELIIQLCDNDLLAKSRDQVMADVLARPDVLIFGAGHVGNAIARACSLLPLKPVLIDTRQQELDAAPEGIETRLTSIAESEVRTAQPGSVILILTHDHSLDFLIAAEALLRSDLAYVGMIGSKTKRATFNNWLLREHGFAAPKEALACPIGDTKLNDKRPEVIAALAATEILYALDRDSNNVERVSNTGAALAAHELRPQMR